MNAAPAGKNHCFETTARFQCALLLRHERAVVVVLTILLHEAIHVILSKAKNLFYSCCFPMNVQLS